MTGTSLAALQVHCDEMPLQIRRTKSQARYAIKVKSTPNHISSNIFEDHWTNHYGKYNNRNRTIAAKVNEILETVDDQRDNRDQFDETPPWLISPIIIDDSLTHEISKHEAPQVLCTLSRDVIDTYRSYIHIYTDASKTLNGRVGIGCYIERSDTYEELLLQQRISDSATVYTSEMTAIKTALQIAKDYVKETHKPVAIFSDSLSAIKTIENQQINNQTKLLKEVMECKHELNCEVSLIWVPSHVGIRGNEITNNLAYRATQTTNRYSSQPRNIGYVLYNRELL